MKKGPFKAYLKDFKIMGEHYLEFLEASFPFSSSVISRDFNIFHLSNKLKHPNDKMICFFKPPKFIFLFEENEC